MRTIRGKAFGILIFAILLAAGNSDAAVLTADGGGNGGGGINGSVAYGPAMWNSTNFPALLIRETLNVTSISDRTIDVDQLIYYTWGEPRYLQVVDRQYNRDADRAIAAGLEQFGNGSMAGVSGISGAGQYTIIGWLGEKYVAIKKKPYKLTGLVYEQNPDDMKNLVIGETWDIAEGWELTLNSTDINASPAQARFILSKEGFMKDEKIVTAGTPDATPVYTYVEMSLAGENDVPVFVTYADNITSDAVQLKYTWLISSNVTLIMAGDLFGLMKVTQLDPPVLMNTDSTIVLARDSTINFMDDFYFRVNDSENLEYYPMKIFGPSINLPPVADFIYLPSNPVVDQIITFDASPSYDPDGNITTYWWNIGGNIFTTSIVNITFPVEGNYYAELAVTDNEGATSYTARWIYVAAPPAIPPANDDFNNATVVSALPFTDALNTVGATTAFDDPVCAGNGHTVWYSFTPTENVNIEANTYGSNYDTTLSAYTGSRGELNQIACNDDYYGTQSRISFEAFAGQTVFFMVGSFGGGPGGDLILNVSLIPPPPIPPENDDFDSATVISALPFIDSINTVNATTAFDDPYSCVWYYGHTVWYSFTPAENMRIEVNPAGSDYSPVLIAAYQGSRGALYQIASNLVYDQPLVVYAYGNQTVFFMVGSYDGNPGGNLNLKVDLIPPLTVNLNIDPEGSINRLTGDAMIHGTLTCSRPVSASLSGELSQRAGRFTVIRGSYDLQFWCDGNSTTWNATVRGSNGPFNAGQASADAFASAYDWTYGDYAADDASAVVQLKGKER